MCRFPCTCLSLVGLSSRAVKPSQPSLSVNTGYQPHSPFTPEGQSTRGLTCFPLNSHFLLEAESWENFPGRLCGNIAPFKNKMTFSKKVLWGGRIIMDLAPSLGTPPLYPWDQKYIGHKILSPGN